MQPVREQRTLFLLFHSPQLLHCTRSQILHEHCGLFHNSAVMLEYRLGLNGLKDEEEKKNSMTLISIVWMQMSGQSSSNPQHDPPVQTFHWVKGRLTGFDAESLDLSAHVIGSVAQGADVRGDFDWHHAVSHVLVCFAHHLVPALWRHLWEHQTHVYIRLDNL